MSRQAPTEPCIPLGPFSREEECTGWLGSTMRTHGACACRLCFVAPVLLVAVQGLSSFTKLMAQSIFGTSRPTIHSWMCLGKCRLALKIQFFANRQLLQLAWIWAASYPRLSFTGWPNIWPGAGLCWCQEPGSGLHCASYIHCGIHRQICCVFCNSAQEASERCRCL